MGLTLHWCEKCGTKIYKEGDAEEFKGLAIVQAGTLDGNGEGDGKGGVEGMGLQDVRPGVELWVGDRVPWLQAREGTGQCATFV